MIKFDAVVFIVSFQEMIDSDDWAGWGSRQDFLTRFWLRNDGIRWCFLYRFSLRNCQFWRLSWMRLHIRFPGSVQSRCCFLHRFCLRNNQFWWLAGWGSWFILLTRLSLKIIDCVAVFFIDSLHEIINSDDWPRWGSRINVLTRNDQIRCCFLHRCCLRNDQF